MHRSTLAALALLAPSVAWADAPRPAPPPAPHVAAPRPAPLAQAPRVVPPPAVHVAAPRPAGRIAVALHELRDAALQAGGLAVGLGEKALGARDPDFTGAFHPIEVKPPPRAPGAAPARSLLVYRSNQARTVDDVASFVELAKQRGVTDRSQIAFINLRSEKEEDAPLVAEYERAVPDAHGAIKTVDVKILDNAPPAFYVGPVGWSHALEKVRQVYVALKDPHVKIAVIHCEQGHGRTGEVVAAAVRIALDGMSGEEALAESEQLGLTMPWQKDFILRFGREWRAGRISFDAPSPASAATP